LTEFDQKLILTPNMISPLIRTLIRYSLLNRSLSTPANPHLINLEASVARHTNSANNSISGSSTAGNHSALNQLITATNQQHAKSIRADTPSSLPTSAAAGTLVPSSASSSVASSGSTVAATTVITDATARRERTSDDVAYRFAIRQGGLFVTHFLKGRLEILRMIKRQMFGDMLTSVGDYLVLGLYNYYLIPLFELQFTNISVVFVLGHRRKTAAGLFSPT
jgi:hypothetical protein